MKRPCLTMGILGIVVCCVAGIALWFGRNSIPAVSSLLATNTPTTTMTFTPTNTSTATLTRTPRPTPTATPDRRVLNPANQHLYLYVRIQKTWHEARDYCASLGGHLVTIQAPSENRFVYELDQLASDNATLFGVWLGATDEVKEGTWVWVTGEPWNYWNWGEGQPNDKAGGEIQPNADFLAFAFWERTWMDWNEGNCYFVCEWEP